MTDVEHLRKLGKSLGVVANKNAFTPSERGVAAGDIAIAVLDAADTIEALRREVARLEDKDALGAERDLFETMYKQAEQRADALERRLREHRHLMSDLLDVWDAEWQPGKSLRSRAVELVQAKP